MPTNRAEPVRPGQSGLHSDGPNKLARKFVAKLTRGRTVHAHSVPADLPDRDVA
jgi:hypothetical protein